MELRIIDKVKDCPPCPYLELRFDYETGMSRGREWENIGYIGADGITISDDYDVWQGKLLELNQTVSIAVKPQWWSLNRLYKLVTGRYMYTVPRLRRWNKGHGRSH